MSRSKKLLSVLVLLALSACGSLSTTTQSSTATESAQIVNGLTIEPNADLRSANLSGAYLSDANLFGANLSRANLSGANLTNANLDQANLLGANLSGANLDQANLSGANLDQANLSGADLTNANLYGADLTGANLIGANLSGANLDQADLTGANLTGANLVGTILEGSNAITTTTAIATIPEATATGNSDYGMICIPGSSCSHSFGGDRKYLDLVKTNLPLSYYDKLSDSQLFKMAYYWCGFLYKNEWSKIEELFDGAYERGERNTQQLYIYTLLGAVTNYCLFVHDKKVGEYLDNLRKL